MPYLTLDNCRTILRDAVLRSNNISDTVLDYALISAVNEFYTRVHPEREIKTDTILSTEQIIDLGLDPAKVIRIKVGSPNRGRTDVSLVDHTWFNNTRRGINVWGLRLPPGFDASRNFSQSPFAHVDRVTGGIRPSPATSFYQVLAAFDPMKKGSATQGELEFWHKFSEDTSVWTYHWKPFIEFQMGSNDAGGNIDPTVGPVDPSVYELPIEQRLVGGLLNYGVPCYYNDRTAVGSSNQSTRDLFEKHIKESLRIADSFDDIEDV